MDTKIEAVREQIESLIESSDSIHRKIGQTRFNRMIPFSVLGMQRATAEIRAKVLGYCKFWGLRDAMYCEQTRAFHFTLDVNAVTRRYVI